MKRINIIIQNTFDNTTHVPTKKDFNNWIKNVCHCTSFKINITIKIVNPIEMRLLNHKYRNINQITNILTFSYSKYDINHQYCTGDLVICSHKIKEESLIQKKK